MIIKGWIIITNKASHKCIRDINAIVKQIEVAWEPSGEVVAFKIIVAGCICMDIISHFFAIIGSRTSDTVQVVDVSSTLETGEYKRDALGHIRHVGHHGKAINSSTSRFCMQNMLAMRPIKKVIEFLTKRYIRNRIPCIIKSLNWVRILSIHVLHFGIRQAGIEKRDGVLGFRNSPQNKTQ